ncbi:carbohydrate porin [Vitiosangium sp. GDMCC 1.1324]|uniref:carbohydrate porin n=1 Tax=Vitiosangium sp. (strain GDMCC 1.1324) TaxID=2138576 RepID=UPI000D3CE9B2|nr:carbohydrate porin [Vitiosangium sp. GDMCC 1.1324]PTL76360.1 maltoporin [Vitiosangium sp. GDMCC 1.1324]
MKSFASLFRPSCSVRSLVTAATLLSAVPASAQSLADRLDFSMYGRVGVAWAPSSGDFIQGKSMNLTGNSLGGRLEEGDYLEPSLKIHLLKPSAEELAENKEAPYAHAVLTPAMWANNGLFIALTSNRGAQTLTLELGEAYVEAGNLLIPGLKFWGGARFYRGTNVYLADYWYFNNLSAQGAGFKYRGLDVAVLLQTSINGSQYNFDSNGDGILDVRRQRTILVGQYKQEFTGGHYAQLLGELHGLPETKAPSVADRSVLPADIGWVAGLKTHLNLGNDSFNELSVRYGRRIANGGQAGSPTWVTFGSPAANGKYGNANSLEVVEQVLYNVNPTLSLNAYGTLHYGQGATDATTDKFMDFSVGAQSTVYLHKNFHLMNEASFQGVRDGSNPFGTAVKLSLVPTLVPTGQLSPFARPHLRLFYTLAFYNKQAVDTLHSPYLQTVGGKSIGHFLGARVEWWI